jgi:ribonuclease P protein subunit RPR2
MLLFVRVKRKFAKEIGKERTNIVVASALHYSKFNEDMANVQAQLAKKIAMRVRLKLHYEIRQLFCKKCKNFIIPGRSSRVRVGRFRVKGIRITCLRCGHVYRKIIKS